MKRRADRGKDRPGRLYTAFLVRIRREDGQWRYFLENVATRDRGGFTRLEALCRYVQHYLDDMVRQLQDND